LAVFYRDSGYAPGLIKLGSIDADGKKLASYKQPIAARLDVFKKETD
jgi:hypothetical protein